MFTLSEDGLNPQVCLSKSQKEAVTAAQFLAMVGAMVERLRTKGDRFALSFEDSYLFSVAVFAAMALRRKIVILPNNKSGTLEALRAHYDSILSEESFAGLVPLSAPTSYQIHKDSELVFLTSGSSGAAKRVEKRFENLYAEVQCLEKTFYNKKAEVILATVSHQHIYGFLFKILWPICMKRTFMAATMEYPEQLAAVAAKVESFSLVSTPAFLKRYFLPDSTIKNCRAIFSSGGLLDFSVVGKNADSFGVIPTEIFGSTESGGVAYREQRKDATLWKCFAGVQVRVAEDSQMLVRSAYFDEPSLLMGDRAELTQEGFTLLGRNDDIFKVEEKRVSLSEINQKIFGFTLIEDSAVVFLEEALRQQTACVAVLSEAGSKLLKERGENFVVQEIRNCLRTSFEASVIPRKFRFVEKLPYNSQFKLSKGDLLAFFKGEEALDVRVLEKDSRSLSLEVMFSKKLEFFEGHFPGLPLLPGVIQSHLAIKLFEKYFGQKIKFSGLKNVKFFNPIFPEIRMQLHCELEADKGYLRFQYSMGDKVFSRGTVIISGT